MKRIPKSEAQRCALQESALEMEEARVLAVKNKATKKLSEDDERVDRALQKMKESSGAKARGVADRLLLQAASAISPDWRSKDATPGLQLELAVNSLAE